MSLILIIVFCLSFFAPKNVEASIHISQKPKITAVVTPTLQGIKFQALEIKKAAKVLGGSVDVEALFEKYSSEYGADKNLMKKIANCESHFNTTSRNGDYGGMFQFSTGTWQGTRAQMGLDPNPDLRFSGEEAIRTAAFKISRGGVSAWANCAK